MKGLVFLSITNPHSLSISEHIEYDACFHPLLLNYCANLHSHKMPIIVQVTTYKLVCQPDLDFSSNGLKWLHLEKRLPKNNFIKKY